MEYWFIAGLIGTVIFLVHRWWIQDIERFTVADAIWYIVCVVAGYLTFTLAMFLLLVEILGADITKRIVEFELWKRKD